jgi:hypothetical protein
MLGKKRRGVSVKNKTETRPLCNQSCQLIERYPQELSALPRERGSDTFTGIKKSKFAQTLAVSHRRERDLFTLRDNIDRTHLDDEDGIGVLTSVINTVARREVFFLSDSCQSREIASSDVANK